MDNSHLLGGGTYYSVLVTYSTVQHTQKADVSITWSDICEFTEQILEDYEHEDAFVLNQFITFLKENGMGKAEPIKPEALLGYWAAVNLEYRLNTVFSQLEDVDWNGLCPGLKVFSPATFNPKFSKMRWGRLGIDFFESWTPGLFAGILMHTIDHRLQPMDVKKGPDFVVFIESVYDKKNSRHMDIYKSITESQEHRNRTQRLSLNSGSFEYLPGIPDSKWRVAVLRKPLFDILENKYTKQEQFDAIKDAIVEAINLLIAK